MERHRFTFTRRNGKTLTVELEINPEGLARYMGNAQRKTVCGGAVKARYEEGAQ